MDIRKLPTVLSPLNPGGNFCGHQAGDNLYSTMRKLPYTFSSPGFSKTGTKIPLSLQFKYKTYKLHWRRGGPCPECRRRCIATSCPSGCHDGTRFAYDVRLYSVGAQSHLVTIAGD